MRSGLPQSRHFSVRVHITSTSTTQMLDAWYVFVCSYSELAMHPGACTETENPADSEPGFAWVRHYKFGFSIYPWCAGIVVGPRCFEAPATNLQTRTRKGHYCAREHSQAQTETNRAVDTSNRVQVLGANRLGKVGVFEFFTQKLQSLLEFELASQLRGDFLLDVVWYVGARRVRKRAIIFLLLFLSKS